MCASSSLCFFSGRLILHVCATFFQVYLTDTFAAAAEIMYCSLLIILFQAADLLQ